MARKAALKVGMETLTAPRMKGWSRSSLRPSRSVADSASVRATMMPATPMMSSWKRAAESRFTCSSSETSTLPPWWPHFFTPGFWSSMW